MNNDLISRSGLKKKLQARHDNGEEDFDKGYNIGIETAIDLIDNAPAVETSLELKNLTEEEKQQFFLMWQRATGKGLFVIEPERPQGEWIEDYTAKKKRVVACNKCHCLNIMGKSNFCPNCGAYMRQSNKSAN